MVTISFMMEASRTVLNKGTAVTPLNFDEFPVYIDALDLIQRAVTWLVAQLCFKAELALIEAADSTSKFFSKVR